MKFRGKATRFGSTRVARRLMVAGTRWMLVCLQGRGEKMTSRAGEGQGKEGGKARCRSRVSQRTKRSPQGYKREREVKSNRARGGPEERIRK